MATITEIARDVLIEQNRSHVSWGDTGILGEIASRANVAGEHPLDRMQRVVDALARSSQTIFEKTYLRAHDSRGWPRLVRSFRLAEKPVGGD